MNLTDVLLQEHRIIEQVLDRLAGLAATARVSRELDDRTAARVLQFLRTFAHRCHQAKEIDILVPALVRRGIPASTEPIVDLHRQTTRCRQLVRSMDRALERLPSRVDEDLLGFCSDAEEYVRSMRRHMKSEDEVLLPMAEALLGAAEQARILRQFVRADEELIGPGVHDAMLDLASELAAETDAAERTL